MKYTPSKRWSWSRLSPVQREHFLLAGSFIGEFSVKDFQERYREQFPARPEGSMLISDFAYNNEQRANSRYPSFVEKTKRGVYRYVGLVDPVR